MRFLSRVSRLKPQNSQNSSKPNRFAQCPIGDFNNAGLWVLIRTTFPIPKWHSLNAGFCCGSPVVAFTIVHLRPVNMQHFMPSAWDVAPER
ncbi:MAG: hypothetical protein IJC40_03090 [Muribaculaceae bacterium]|nr:hypothetical protein [Muribaculaceae bacterium]